MIEIDAHLHVSLQRKYCHFAGVLASLKFSLLLLLIHHLLFHLLKMLWLWLVEAETSWRSIYVFVRGSEGLFGVLPISLLLQQNIEALLRFWKINWLILKRTSALDKLIKMKVLEFWILYFVNLAKLNPTKQRGSSMFNVVREWIDPCIASQQAKVWFWRCMEKHWASILKKCYICETSEPLVMWNTSRFHMRMIII
jgi:hypothetical protein